MGAPTRDGREVYRDLRGELVTVDPSKAAELVDAGQLEAVSDESVKRADRLADLQTPGAIAETALKSGLNAAAAPVVWGAEKLGLGDIRDIGMSPEEAAVYHQREADLAAANPIAAGVGNIAGSTFGLGKLGVLGAAGKARAAIGGFRGALAGGAIEGAVFGANEAMAEDPRQSAEHVLAAGAMGALLGAGTGGLLHGAGRGLARVFGSVESNALTREAAELAQSSVEAEKGTAAKFWDKLTGKVSSAPRELLEEVGPTGTRRAEAIAAAEGFDRWADETALKMQKLSNEASKARDAVIKTVTNREMRAEGIRELTNDAWNNSERRKFAAAATKIIGDNLEEAVGSLRVVGKNGDLPVYSLLPASIKKQLAMVQRQTNHMLESFTPETDAAERYVSLHQLKTNLQKTVDGMQITANESQHLDSFERGAIRSAAAKVEHIQEQLRQSLIDEKVWGKEVTGAYRELNEIWHEGAIEALNNYGHQFQRWTGQRDYANQSRKIFEDDPAKLLSSLKSIGTANGAIAERTMLDYLHHTDRLIEKIGSRFGLSDAEAQAVDVARGKFRELSELFEQARDRAGLADKFRRLETYKAGGLLQVAPVLGGFVGSGPGAALGTVLSAAGNPAATAKFVQGVSGTARNWVQTDVVDSLAKWVQSGGVKMRPPAGVLTSAAVETFQGKHAGLGSAYQERARQLLSADPTTLGQHLADTDSDTVVNAGAQASAALSFLRDQLPPYLQSTTLLRSTRNLPISQPDLMKFARVWGTIADPSTAVDDIKRGRFTPAQAQALKQIYPGIYDSIRAGVIQSIGAADATGKPVPIQVREQLSILLDLDGAGEPALSSRFAARVQQIQEQSKPKPKQRPPSAGPVKSIISTRTPFEQAIGI